MTLCGDVSYKATFKKKLRWYGRGAGVKVLALPAAIPHLIPSATVALPGTARMIPEPGVSPKHCWVRQSPHQGIIDL